MAQQLAGHFRGLVHHDLDTFLSGILPRQIHRCRKLRLPPPRFRNRRVPPAHEPPRALVSLATSPSSVNENALKCDCKKLCNPQQWCGRTLDQRLCGVAWRHTSGSILDGSIQAGGSEFTSGLRDGFEGGTELAERQKRDQ